MPNQNEIWLREKIKPLWVSILHKIEWPSAEKRSIQKLLEGLRRSFHVGLDKVLRNKIKAVPEEIKERWVDLSYREINGRTNGLIQEHIDLLDRIDLDLPRKGHSLKNLIYLKELVELIPEIENKLNNRLELFKNSGQSDKAKTQRKAENLKIIAR